MHRQSIKYRRAFARKKFYAHLKSVKRKGREYISTLLPLSQKNDSSYRPHKPAFKKPIKFIAPIDFSLEIISALCGEEVAKEKSAAIIYK